MRVSARSVLNHLRTSSLVDRATPWRPIASKSARRRRVGSTGTGLRGPPSSGAQPLAPLGTTTSQHAAAALRRHPGHEAVLALAGALLGLIRPLHRFVPLTSFSVRVPGLHTRTAGVPPACARSLARFALVADSTVHRWAGQTRIRLGGADRCGGRMSRGVVQASHSSTAAVTRPHEQHAGERVMLSGDRHGRQTQHGPGHR